MGSAEYIFAIVIGSIVLALPLATLVLSLIAFRRSGKIAGLALTIKQLESQVGAIHAELASRSSVPVNTPAELISSSPQPATIVAAVLAEPAVSRSEELRGDPIGWETFIGQKAFGWLAVILFGLSATFFLRYAFQNNWIGPVGRVAIGELIGLGLTALGVWYHNHGLKRFSSMVTSAGIVVLYLATYSAFALYRLLPQSHTGLFLGILVFESMLAAFLYRSSSIALAAVIGGLLTPVLLSSDHDAYRALFAYLAVLNIAAVLAATLKRWSIVTAVCYLGTQGLFWLWFGGQYHPEKFAWAIGFQSILFATYLCQSVFEKRLHLSAPPKTDLGQWEELARLIVNALIGFASMQALMRFEYPQWLGVLAIGMATLYAFAAHLLLRSGSQDNRSLFTSLALSLGFVAWALPVQANTLWYSFDPWIGMGWAVIGYALWRFGFRIAAPPLRVFAALFAIAAVWRFLVSDLPLYVREPFIPVFNSFAFPSLAIATCILLAVLAADSHWNNIQRREQICVGIAGVVGVVVVWLVLSLDCYDYFVSRSLIGGEISTWRWRGQLALTVLWTALATILLVGGFVFNRARLRWLGMSLYGLTVIKLFLVDMANVQQIYRILGFFILAVVLGLVARSYQRFK